MLEETVGYPTPRATTEPSKRRQPRSIFTNVERRELSAEENVTAEQTERGPSAAIKSSYLFILYLY